MNSMRHSTNEQLQAERQTSGSLKESPKSLAGSEHSPWMDGDKEKQQVICGWRDGLGKHEQDPVPGLSHFGIVDFS